MKCKRWAEQKKGETVKNGRVFKEHMLALTQEANNPTGPGERDPFKLDFWKQTFSLFLAVYCLLVMYNMAHSGGFTFVRFVCLVHRVLSARNIIVV